MVHPYIGLVVCCALLVAGTSCSGPARGGSAKSASSSAVTQVLTQSKLSVTPPTVVTQTLTGGSGVVALSYVGPYSIAVARQTVLPAANYTLWVDSYPANTNGALVGYETSDPDVAANEVATAISGSGWMVMSRSPAFSFQGTGRVRSLRPRITDLLLLAASGDASLLSVIEPLGSGGDREYFFFIDGGGTELSFEAACNGTVIASSQLASGKFMYFDFAKCQWQGPDPLPKLSDVPAFVATALSESFTRSGKLFYTP